MTYIWQEELVELLIFRGGTNPNNREEERFSCYSGQQNSRDRQQDVCRTGDITDSPVSRRSEARCGTFVWTHDQSWLDLTSIQRIFVPSSPSLPNIWKAESTSPPQQAAVGLPHRSLSLCSFIYLFINLFYFLETWWGGSARWWEGRRLSQRAGACFYRGASSAACAVTAPSHNALTVVLLINYSGLKERAKERSSSATWRWDKCLLASKGAHGCSGSSSSSSGEAASRSSCQGKQCCDWLLGSQT